jgi:hypothetical protein
LLVVGVVVFDLIGNGIGNGIGNRITSATNTRKVCASVAADAVGGGGG